ncbi:hypothetical protein D3C75_806520 [compost metagenome]
MTVIRRMIVGRIINIEAVGLDIIQCTGIGHGPCSPAERSRISFMMVECHFQIGKLHIMRGDDIPKLMKSIITVLRKSSCDKDVSCCNKSCFSAHRLFSEDMT